MTDPAHNAEYVALGKQVSSDVMCGRKGPDPSLAEGPGQSTTCKEVADR